MALDQPEPHALLSKMIQHFFGVADDQMKDDFRTRLLVVLLAEPEVEQNKRPNERSAVDRPTRQFRSRARGDRN